MKIRFILIQIAMLLGMANAAAGTFVADERTEHSTLDLHKIVFRDGNVDTYFKNGDMDSYEFSSVQRIYYANAPQNPTEEEALSASADGVNVYPNPAHNVLYISGVEEGGAVKIMDITGRVLRIITADSEIIETNISSLSKGMYFVVAGENVVKFIKK